MRRRLNRRISGQPLSCEVLLTFIILCGGDYLHALPSGYLNRRAPHCPYCLPCGQSRCRECASGYEPQKIVNWDVAAQKLRSSITTMKEEVREVRQDVHEATR